MRLPTDLVRWLMSRVPAAGRAPLSAWVEARLERVAGVDAASVRDIARTLDDLAAIDANIAAAIRELRETIAQREGSGPSTYAALATITGSQRRDARAAATAAVDVLDAEVRATATASASLAAAARQASEGSEAASKRVQEAQDGVAKLQARLTALSAPHLAATPPPAPSGCKVPGCEGSHRARGFCGKHYQLWRRDLLEGYVRFEGGVRIEGVLHAADKADAGRPAHLLGGRLILD